MCTRVISVVGLLVAPPRAMNRLRATVQHAWTALSKAHAQLVRNLALTARALFTSILSVRARETA